MPRERARRQNREDGAAGRRRVEHAPDRRAIRAGARAAARDARRREVQNALRGGNGQENIPLPPPQFVTAEVQTDDCCFEQPHVAWIVGSSIPYWAEQRARYRSPSSSSNLGIDERKITVQWMTRRGMVWDEVRPMLARAFKEAPYLPDAIIIHCGGNSLLQQKKDTTLEPDIGYMRCDDNDNSKLLN
ncbi:uncharacterized protein LOC128547006 [Mercenaria mercenaria]|uniref:uncharacterized protein LOC128547006 n=1 Tax=Mercenaria mercenaria TaxID=6596 RepID=UPI00234E65F5|nr:uncharacterized protein LOC128547006 [Mercenaria mercenaria]